MNHEQNASLLFNSKEVIIIADRLVTSGIASEELGVLQLVELSPAGLKKATTKDGYLGFTIKGSWYSGNFLYKKGDPVPVSQNLHGYAVKFIEGKPRGGDKVYYDLKQSTFTITENDDCIDIGYAVAEIRKQQEDSYIILTKLMNNNF